MLKKILNIGAIAIEWSMKTAAAMTMVCGMEGAWAGVNDTKTRDQISDKARNRLYDGGIDEQPLVVQKNLEEPRRESSEYSLQKKILEHDAENVEDETAGGF